MECVQIVPVKNTFVHFPPGPSSLEVGSAMRRAQSDSSLTSRRGAQSEAEEARWCRKESPEHFSGSEASWVGCSCGGTSDSEQTRSGDSGESICADETGISEASWDTCSEGSFDVQSGVPSERQPRMEAAVLSRAAKDSQAMAVAMLTACGGEATHSGAISMVVGRAPGSWSACWTVSAALVKGRACKIFSPEFCLFFPGAGPCFFQLGLFAIHKSGVTSFQQALGKGRMEMKCLGELPKGIGETTFTMKIGAGHCRHAEQRFISHDFSAKARCNLRRLDFASAADLCTGSLVVDLCFGPGAALGAYVGQPGR